MRSGIVLLFLASALVVSSQEEKKEEDLKNPVAGAPEAVEAGRALYLASCSACHGPNAEGGRGPRLVNSGEVRGATNRRLFLAIKDGIRGSDMPPSPLADDKIWELVTYVKSLNAPAYESKVNGNPAAGEQLFHGKGGCATCHAIGGKGGFLGPDLTNVGMARPLAHIEESLLKPSERPTEGFQAVTVTTRGGKRIEGVAKNNTNYSIQVLDATGRLHLLSKLDLAEVVLRKNSLMPGDYAKRLTKEEIGDLLAYLSRQAARPPRKEETSK